MLKHCVFAVILAGLVCAGAAVAQDNGNTDQQAPRTPGETARCIFESLSFAYREASGQFERVTRRRLDTIRLVGGGCLNRFLSQMIADACGRTVVAGPAEAAALGNAMVQAVATGHLGDLAEGREAIKSSFECRTYAPALQQGWDEAFERFESVVARARIHQSAAANR